MSNLFTTDVGQKKLHAYDSANDIFYPKKPQEDLIQLNIIGLSRGDILIIEDAHARESHKLTKAQPYTFEELVELQENAIRKGVKILLFPHDSTPKARKLSGYSSDDKRKGKDGLSGDEIDCKSIANFLYKDKNAFESLKEFVPKKLDDFHKKKDHEFTFIKDSNDILNEARGVDYNLGEDPDLEDEIANWIKKYATRGGQNVFGEFTHSIYTYLNGDEELLSFIGLKVKKNEVKIDNAMRIYTLVASILNPDGSLRLRTDFNKPPFFKFIFATYFGCKPLHKNQGVAASNYKFHWRIAESKYRNPLKFEFDEYGEPLLKKKSPDIQVGMDFEEYKKFKVERSKVDKKLKKVWNILRKMIVEDVLR
tara:strand:- start:430 stop:1527 length:1098 start_codon:yes stop_codon:yes gene_type:complete